MNIACSCYEAVLYMLLMVNPVRDLLLYLNSRLVREQSKSIETLGGLEHEGESSRVSGRISLWRLNNEH